MSDLPSIAKVAAEGLSKETGKVALVILIDPGVEYGSASCGEMPVADLALISMEAVVQLCKQHIVNGTSGSKS